MSYCQDQGILATGDRFGGVKIYSLSNKDAALSEILDHPVYTPAGMGSFSDERFHAGPIKLLSFYQRKDLYSLDGNGMIINWQIKVKDKRIEVTPISSTILQGCTEFLFEENEDQIIAAQSDKFIRLSRFISDQSKIISFNSPFSMGKISSLYYGNLKVGLAGFSNGEVRIYLNEQSDSIYKLKGFTNSQVLMVFPGNYSKMDRVTRSVNIMESICSLFVIDRAGKLYIFDLEKDLKLPEQTIEMLPEEDCELVKISYDFQSSVAHITYKKGQKLFYLAYDMRRFKKKIQKITQLKEMNKNILRILKLSFSN